MAIRGVINEFFSLDDFEKQKKQVSDGIREYIALVDKAPAIKTSLNDSSKIKETVDATKRLAELNQQTTASAIKVTEATREQSKSQEQLIQKLVAGEVAIKELKEGQKQLEASYKSGALTQDQYIIQLSKLREVQDALVVSNTNAKKELKDIEKAYQTQSGSIDAVKISIAQLTAERNKQDLTTAEGIANAAQLNSEIDKQNDIIKENVSLLEKQKINVGNYQGSAKIIVDALEAARQKVSQVSEAFGPLSPEATQARQNLEALGKITENPRFLNIAANIGDTNKELKFFTQQLNVLEDQGLKNTETYAQLRSRLAQLTDQLGDTRAEVKALSSDTRGFDLFAGSVTFAADSFQTLAGAAVLFGASEEDAAKATATLTAVQSVANGVKGIANELTTKGTAANKAYNFVLVQSQKLFGASTTAAQRFSNALKGIGILALIAGLVYLIDKFNLLGKSQKDALGSTEKLTEALQEQADAIANLNSELDFESKLRVEKLKQQGAKEEQIYKEEADNRKAQIDNLERLEEQSYDSRIAARLDYQAAIAVAEFNGKNPETDDLVKNAKDNLDVIKKDYDARRKALSDAVNANELAAAQEETRRIEKEKKDSKDRIKKGQDLFDKEQAAAFARNKQALEREKRDQDNIANGNLYDPRARIAAAVKVGEIEKKILDAQQAYDLKQKDITKSGRLAIEEKYSDDLTQLAFKTQSRLINIQYEGIRKLADARQEDIDRANEIEQQMADDEAKRIEKQINGIKQHAQERLDVIENTRNVDTKTLNEQHAAGKISEEQYQKELLKIEAKALKDSLLEKINHDKQLIALTTLSKDERASVELELSDLEKQLSAISIETHKNTYDELAKNLEQIKGYYDQVAAVVGSAFDAAATRQKNAIQEQINLLDERTKKEIDAAEQSGLSEQKKADKVAVIQAKADLQKQQYERKQREVDQRKARFDKASAITSIVLNSAIAISKFLAKGDIFEAIAAGILGAAQLAIAISTPIPKYKDGTENHPGGIAIVGDGNKSEGVILPSGRVIKSPARSTLMDLPKGTKVKPDFDRMLLQASMPNVPDRREVTINDAVEVAVAKSAKDIVGAIKRIPQPIYQGEPRHKYMLRQGHSFRTYLNNNL